MRINVLMLMWGLVCLKIVYDWVKLRMGVWVWCWSWIRGVVDCLRVVVFRKGVMVLRRVGMVIIWELFIKIEGC